MSKEKHPREDKKKKEDEKPQTEVVEKGEKKEPKPATKTELL